ncbi:MAG TPA: DEAD/DEAH box helicase [Candidatus Nanoarchaeia archaeon]|nr:DEAD/DEAH box helicase [Candidatus Nanoarchaeia archaeon]
MLKDFTPRLYQETILDTCAKKNTLVVLPTGMGKTAIALMLSAQRLHNFPNSCAIFLAPTKPLAMQHKESFKRYMHYEDAQMVLFTGSVSPEERAEQWKSAKIIFGTPECIENDIISGRVDLSSVSLIIFDEAHRASGEYSYTFIAKQYASKAKFPRILALTASPGSDQEKIQQICSNLYIEDVEIRTEQDPDVKPYIQKTEVDWIMVDFPNAFSDVRRNLQELFADRVREIRNQGFLKSTRSALPSKVEILQLQGQLQAELSQGSRAPELFRTLSLSAEAMKIQHGSELVETQGITPLLSYLERLNSEGQRGASKAVKNLVIDERFKTALIKTRTLSENGAEHPKLERVKALIQSMMNSGSKRIIVFNQYREMAVRIEKELSSVPGIFPVVFVGQTKKGETGLSQKKQKEIIDKFSNGGYNVLISTSVGEEGLDIPQVDAVIFYEPVPSAIRSIQRRGRTGRLEKGKVVILVTKGTRDESYRWSAKHKEKRMKSTLKDLKKAFTGVSEMRETSLNNYIAPELDLKIFADDREKGAGLIKELVDLGVSVQLKRLDVGDYVISERCAIEYKKVPDFVNSILDGRLLEQLKGMRGLIQRPIIIIEGVEDLYSQRNVHPNAIRGMLATITVSYGVPILQTKTAKESAAIIALMAKREQDETTKHYSPHAEKKALTMKEMQEYIVSALPGVGGGLAKPLLQKFGNVRNVMTATTDELKEVEKIGEKKAKEIQRVLGEKYEEP